MVFIDNCTLGQLDEAIKNKRNKILQFSASWCGPCRMIAPDVKEIAAANNEFDIFYVDIDTHGELAGKFGIKSVPTFVFLNENGEKIEQISGANKETLKQNIRKHFKSKTC